MLLDYVHKGLGGYWDTLRTIPFVDFCCDFLLESHDKRKGDFHVFTWDVRPNLKKVISLQV